MASTAITSDLDLANYMLGVLKRAGEVLGWGSKIDPDQDGDPADGIFNDAIQGTYDELGVDDLSDLEPGDMPLLRAAARLHVWQSVADTTAGMPDFSADTSSFSRKQLHDMALDRVTDAKQRLADMRDRGADIQGASGNHGYTGAVASEAWF